MFERLEDAAEVHRLTGAAPAVALHFPWDAVEDLGALRATPPISGCASARSTPTCSRTLTTGSARSPTPIRGSVARRSTHLLECVEVATALGSTAQSLWLADGTNYPGQDDLAARHERVVECLVEFYAALPPEQELLVEYKLFEPAFYATDIAIGALPC